MHLCMGVSEVVIDEHTNRVATPTFQSEVLLGDSGALKPPPRRKQREYGAYTSTFANSGCSLPLDRSPVFSADMSNTELKKRNANVSNHAVAVEAKASIADVARSVTAMTSFKSTIFDEDNENVTTTTTTTHQVGHPHVSDVTPPPPPPPAKRYVNTRTTSSTIFSHYSPEVSPAASVAAVVKASNTSVEPVPLTAKRGKSRITHSQISFA